MNTMNRRQFGAAALGAFSIVERAQGFAETPPLDDNERGVQAARQSGGYRYVHLDVFTDTRLQGNQLFVYTDPAGLDADAMLTLTRESNLSENTFVFPAEQAGTNYRVRIFTRAAETPFAGHPTIGTAFALAIPAR